MGILDSALSYLLTDPTQSGGGILASLLKGGNPGALTSTPLAPVPSQLGSPFQFRGGILGDSPIANGIRGGLAGLAGSNGYTGLSAVGAGAQSAIQAGQKRQLFNIENMLAGQDYKKGQQDLVGGNLSNIFALDKVNAMIDDQNQQYGTNTPHLTMNDLNNNPDLVTSMTQGQGAPQGQPQPNQPPAPIDPTAQGGQSESTFMMGPNGYGSSQLPAPPQGQPPAAPPGVTPQQSGGDSSDPNVQWYQQKLAAINGLQWAAPEVYKEKLAALQSDPRYLALSANTTAKANEAAKWNSPQATFNNVKDFASAFQGQDQVKTYNDVRPTYDAVVAAYKSYDPKAGVDVQLPNDFDFASGVLKMINPRAANLRPNSVEAVEEAKGYQALWQKVKQQLSGKTGLTQETRDALMQVAKQHMDAYQREYDTTLGGYRARAKLLGPGVTEDMWTGGAAPQGNAGASNSAPEGTIVSNGAQTLKKVNGQWVPQ